MEKHKLQISPGYNIFSREFQILSDAANYITENFKVEDTFYSSVDNKTEIDTFNFNCSHEDFQKIQEFLRGKGIMIE
jgi:hypothetical protein